MNVFFYEPPEKQRAGGLELAVRSLERFLLQAGVSVGTNPLSWKGQPRPHVVHFHGLWQPEFLWVSALCRRRGIPYVVSPHGMLEPWAWRHKRWKKWPWYHLFERRHLSGASLLLGTSEGEVGNISERLPMANCRALPLGLTAEFGPDYADARRKLDWSDSEFVLLFLSRVHPKKGIHLLLQSLIGLDRELLRNVRLVIVGGGERKYLNVLAEFVQREFSRLPRVDWLGEIWGDAKWAYFQGADLFVLPSHSENFGLAILEALQVGTPVLTTNQTPWGIVSSLGAATIVDATEEGIRAALAAFLENRNWTMDQRKALADAIHERYSWDRVGPAYVELYDEISIKGRK